MCFLIIYLDVTLLNLISTQKKNWFDFYLYFRISVFHLDSIDSYDFYQ